jgi:hypothetical protein
MPIFNLFTRKFSQFVAQNVAEPVGLTGGANSIGPSGGGGASITYTFTQATVVVPALYLGAAVRVDEATGLWMCTLATTALGAEFYGFIIGIAGNTYTVQFAGEVPAGTPFLTGLIAGTPYYLSDTIAGGISAIPPAVVGEVNLPVLWAMDNGNSVIKMSRGFVEGSGGGEGGGGGGMPNNVANVTQNGNTFALGDVLYLLSDQTFALANAYESFAASQAEWMVTAIVTPNSVFTIQQGGQVKGLVTTDDMGANIQSGPFYYVSPIVGKEGKLTMIEPTGNNQFSKPFYVQQVLSSSTGWLLDQRPLPASGSPPPPPTPILVDTSFTSTFTTTATGWVNTGICATITTNSNTQNVLLFSQLNLASDGSNGVAFKIQRNGIDIDIGNVAGSRTQAGGVTHGQILGVDSGIALFDVFLDSPGAAGLYTYCILVNRGASSIANINMGWQDSSNTSSYFRSTTNLLLMLSGV